MHEALLVAGSFRSGRSLRALWQGFTKYLDKQGMQIWRGVTSPAIPPNLACQPVILALLFSGDSFPLTTPPHLSP